MLKELLTAEQANNLDTPSLLKYKRELEKYRKHLLDHMYSYMAHYRNVRWELSERKTNLEIELICLEDDRLSEESSVLYTPEGVH